MTAPHPLEGRTGGPIEGDMRHKSHLLFAWLAELVRCRSILDAVEDLHGPDLLCRTTNFFIKEAADPAFVSWHQDSTYWPEQTRCRDGVGRVHGSDRGQRGNGIDPRQP